MISPEKVAGASTQLEGKTVVYLAKPGSDRSGHEYVSQRVIARWLADLKGARFGGDYDETQHYPVVPYFMPADTLEAQLAARLGVHGVQDLFGGVVPHPFVATKTITHPLISSDAVAPAGWVAAFAEAVQAVVLPGYSAFSRRDALAAGRRLLETGAVRVKLAIGVGGLGQAVAHDVPGLEAALESFDAGGALQEGVVLEPNLTEIATFSAGCARLGEMEVAYYGQQRLTPDNHGHDVYGGSDLVVVRGNFDALQRLDIPEHLHTAMMQARVYHAAALRSFSGLYASRCNYDIAQGRDPTGRQRSGVLEQSWRIGGASGAELAAIQAFTRDPTLNMVRASTTEVYGAGHRVPEDALVYYADVDARVGRLTKYVRIEGYGHNTGRRD